MGYGARALQALNSYYSGEYFNFDESVQKERSYPSAAAIDPVRPLYRYLQNFTDLLEEYRSSNRQTYYPRSIRHASSSTASI